jgi:hypothetical protein
VAAAIGGAAALDPFQTAVCFAVLHNLTPMAFLWQNAEPKNRRRIGLLCLLCFVGVPLVVASGLPRLGLAALGLDLVAADPLQVGTLAEHLRVYVPGALLDQAQARDLFTASVVAQGCHYVSVIVILPAWLSTRRPVLRGRLPWPPVWAFFAGLGLAGAFAFWQFAIDFSGARGLYSLPASVHSWVEIPLILRLLTLTGQNRTIPARQDDRFAAAESISA